MVKPLKIAFLDPIYTRKGSAWATPKMKNFFLTEIIKADHQLSETFYFIKISVLTELGIFFYFFIKKGSFPAKAAVGEHGKPPSRSQEAKPPTFFDFFRLKHRKTAIVTVKIQ